MPLKSDVAFCLLLYKKFKVVHAKMEKYLFSTGTVTYAIKAKELLRRKGINAYVERSMANDRIGCGYGVVVTQDRGTAEQILKQAGIKILDVKKK